MSPRPVIVHIPSGSHRRKREAEAAELRRQERENRYEDDGWACYEVPPDPAPEPLPEWAAWAMFVVALGAGAAMLSFMWLDSRASRRWYR